MSEHLEGIYAFEGFRLDEAKRLLLDPAGAPVPLTPKAFETLVYLLTHQGVLLTKDELMAALWPDTAVEENNLTQNIYTLRRALGEERGAHRFIMTVPGRGYRFVAEVQKVDRPADAPPAPADDRPPAQEPFAVPDPGTTAGTARGRRVRMLRFAVLVALLIAAAAAHRFQKAPAARPVTSMAVLPFKPLIAEQRDPALELGMADTLISRLSTIEQLTVRPLSLVRRFDAADQDPFAAGRALGVEAVLDGHIHRDQDRVRVTVRLVRVGDGRQLWTGQFDEKFTSIFAVQDSISSRVARALAVELTGEEARRLSARSTTDTRAYELYLRGRFFISIAQPQRAIELFEEAVRIDPGFVAAHAGLADIYSRLPIATDIRSGDAMAKATRSAVEALRLDDTAASAHTALGWINFYYEWKWDVSEAEFRRALQLDPHDFSAHLGYAHLLSSTGRHAEALKSVDRAISLDPQSPIAHALKAQFLLFAGRVAEAKTEIEQTLASAPAFWVALVQLGRVHEGESDIASAVDTYRKAGLTAGTLAPLAFETQALFTAGRSEEAERSLLRLRQESANGYLPPYFIASIEAAAGKHDAAIASLERAFIERDVHMVFLGVDPQWEALREDARFVDLLRRMRLADVR